MKTPDETLAAARRKQNEDDRIATEERRREYQRVSRLIWWSAFAGYGAVLVAFLVTALLLSYE